MMESRILEQQLQNGEKDARIEEIYGCTGSETERLRKRCLHVLHGFQETFTQQPLQNVVMASAPGRLEIGGNHTDHQNGCVLAAAVHLDALGAAAQNYSPLIHVYSEGYYLQEVDLSDLVRQDSEKGTTKALIKGVVSGIQKAGWPVQGFDAYIASKVLKGSGLSSSASFEVLLAELINALFCKGELTPLQMAHIAKEAENSWFGKPSGLMDQAVSAYGGLLYLDFADPAVPRVQQIDYDFARAGYDIFVIDSHSSHQDLTAAYAAIPREMQEAASLFGRSKLRGVSASDLLLRAPAIRRQYGDRTFLRAAHFVQENRRVQDEVLALQEHDLDRFFALVRESGSSSAAFLQNLHAEGQIRHQEADAVCACCSLVLEEKGAWRMQGGGFGGTVEAFVPQEMSGYFQWRMDQILGEGSCVRIALRPTGAAVL